MRKVVILWLASIVVTATASHLFTVRFGSVLWKNSPDENVDMIFGVAVPTSQATPEMDEAYFRKKLFGGEMGHEEYPYALYGTELGYRGVIVSKKPLTIENPFRGIFQLW